MKKFGKFIVPGLLSIIAVLLAIQTYFLMSQATTVGKIRSTQIDERLDL